MRTFRILAIGFSAAVVLFSSAVLWVGMRQARLDAERMEAAQSRDSNVYYEIFVRSYRDSDGDGIGDLNGIIEKLDDLQEMGISGIWLTPVHPSPSYHGYDVTDYYAIHDDFGTMADFDRLLAEAHARNIRIIMDLVVNHTSSEHPWFVESAKGADSAKRDWYIWAAEDEARLGAVSATGGRAWHERGGGHYLGVFWDGMPDLNMDHPEVRQEIANIARYWLDKGVDGFRLDAAKHIYEDFQSQHGQQEITQKNVAWWQTFRKELEAEHPDVYLVGEVWDAVSVIGPYLKDAFDSSFNFDLAGQLIGLARSERSADIAFTVNRIHQYYEKVSGGTFEDALILSNHDQNRVMSQLEGNANHAKTAASLLLTLPGKAYLYYGEEIGMQGMKPDENIRKPMRWDEVELQRDDPESLLNRYKQFIQWRKLEPALAFGTIESYGVDHDSVVSFVRALEAERVLVFHNLSGDRVDIDLPSGAFDPQQLEIALSTSRSAAYADGTLTLPGYGSVVLK